MPFDLTISSASAHTTPESPPGMTASKSSKSSSFHSLSSDDASALSDVNHFEDIGLEDDANHHLRFADTDFKQAPNRFAPLFSTDVRPTSLQTKPLHGHRHGPRELARIRPRRDLLASGRPRLSSLQTQVRDPSTTCTGAFLTESLSTNSLTAYTKSSVSLRQRTPSPTMIVSNGLVAPSVLVKPRRRSWQSSRERKSAEELELDCDEDDGDDIPEGLILDNVPISPRPPSERSQPISTTSSTTGSPDRSHKDKPRSIGNGTPPIATAQGSLRSPFWKYDAASAKETPCPSKVRSKSWTTALSELSSEARALTEKLEEHADVQEKRPHAANSTSSPTMRRVVTEPVDRNNRPKFSLPDLPPLRRSNIMIDPLPASKEKEAVLSRTRPSWLPPKDPAEEKRHLREYQKMMAKSVEVERKREMDKQARLHGRDTTAKSLMHIWEDDIIPRWSEAIHERRTRELWWLGIAPRSRGAVWARAIGNELGLAPASFDAALRRARDAKSRVRAKQGTLDDQRHVLSFDAMIKDIDSRTWKELKIFQTGAPLYQSLVDVLMAYCMYRSDIGYVTGSNSIAALLLLNLPDASSAFIGLANLLNRPLPLSFYASDPGAKASAYSLMLQTLFQKSPELHGHLTKVGGHDPDYYFNSVFASLFTSHLALDLTTRLWDVYVFEGDVALIRAGVALLLDNKRALLRTTNPDEIRDILERSKNGSDSQQPRAAQAGEEDRWMSAVREAGKLSKRDQTVVN